MGAFQLFISRVWLIGLTWATLAQAQNAGQGYYNIAGQSNFSFDKMKSLIETEGLSNIESTLEATKKYYPEFFDNYILMYHSRSLQGSSFDAPRALLFDRSGHFVFSFNGKASQRGYDKIEVMQFREQENRFEFREITFTEGGRPQFSEPNPAKCMVCHQDSNRKNTDPRPNWEPYNIWPGAFGSNSGRMDPVSRYNRSEPQFKTADPLIFENMEVENDKAKDFFSQIQPKHPRYRFLNAEKFDSHMTVDFTQMIANLNARRVIRIVQNEWADYYKFIEPAFVGVIMCGEFMVKPEIYEWMKNNWPFPEIANGKVYLERPPIKSVIEIRRALVDRSSGQMSDLSPREIDELANRMYARQFEMRKNYMSVTVSQGLHHLFEPFGISTKDWSTDFMTDGRLAFRERFGTPSNTQDTFRAAFRKVSQNKYEKYICSELGVLAEKGVEDLMKSDLFKKLQEEKLQRELGANASILQRCVKCHTSNDSYIPYIAFDDPEQLKNQLGQRSMYSSRILIDEVRYRLGSYAKNEERMPLGPPVSQKQRDDVVNYLESLLVQRNGQDSKAK